LSPLFLNELNSDIFHSQVWVSLNAFLHYHIRRRVDAGANMTTLAQEIGEALIYIFYHTSHTIDSSLPTAAVMAPALMRDEDDNTDPATPLDKRRFLMHFITD
jgi:hypothetical protein